MIDREKVIKGLECCANNEVVCFSDCPYSKEYTMANGKCITALETDALALLKEQQKLIDEITQRRANDGAFD